MSQSENNSTGGGAARGAVAELLFLALPTIAQMASYTVMQFIDTWMLSHVGAGVVEPTAGSQAGLLAFSVISLGMGVMWVVNTFVSQSYGQKDFAACGQYLWQGVWVGLIFSVLLLPVLPVMSATFSLLGHEPRLAGLEASYLKIVLGASVLKLVGTAVSQFLLAIDRPVQVLMATVLGVTVNAVAAWAMIFGHWGFSAGGVSGAAWAQNVGVLVETGAMIFFAMRPAVRRRFNVGDWKFRASQARALLRVGVPSGLQIVADVLAWTAFSMWVMAAFPGEAGTRAMAATTFVFRFMAVSFMPAYGLSVAVTALVGRYIGAGRPDVSERRAHLGFAVAASYMLVCGLFFFLSRNWLIGLFSADAAVRREGAMLLVFAAVYQFFDAMYIVYNGALRGAGDTFVPAVATGVLCWGITVFGAHAVARARPAWGAAGPWAAATFYGIVLGIFILARFKRGAWKAIRLEEPAASDTVPLLEKAVPN